MTRVQEIECGPYWLKARAVSFAPSLLTTFATLLGGAKMKSSEAFETSAQF